MTQPNTAHYETQVLADKFAQVVKPLVSEGEDFALLDFPDYFNVGDSAIYAGQMIFFDQHVKRNPSYVCSLYSYKGDIAKFCPDGPIFMTGGGNFGDIWRQHQSFRHDVLASNRGRPVIQLPQSIHFRDDAARDETARAIDQHGAYTLLVRDHESFELASKHFDCDVMMCPDAAHNMGELEVLPASHAVLSMLRNDPESRNDEIEPYLATLGPIKDWERQFWARTLTDRMIEKVIAPRIPSNDWLMKRREHMYRRHAWNRIKYGIRFLSEGQLLISDRLHAHIMSSLMGKPHISLDNSYGKISRYIAAWSDGGLVRQVSDLDALKAAVAEMHNRD